MWIATTMGFFSIVENKRDRNHRSLQVRARCYGDLERLSAWVAKYIREIDGKPIISGEMRILETPTADYPVRMILDRRLVETIIAKLVKQIDYGNFKDAVGERRGPKHAHVFHRVWSALLGLEDETRRAH